MLALWRPPHEVRRIVIFGDNDASYTGQVAAYALAGRLRSEGFIVEVEVPAEPETDWNDVHRLRRSGSEIPERFVRCVT
jgi:putative DNA primase/helicase